MSPSSMTGNVFLRLMTAYVFCVCLGFLFKAVGRRIRNMPKREKGSGPGIAEKFLVFFVFEAALLTLSFWWLTGLRFFFALLFLVSVYEIDRLRRTYRINNPFKLAIAAGLLLLFGVSLLSYFTFAGAIQGLPFLALLFLLLAVFDGYSQICGEVFGGPKIVPAISPRKTWSGFLGGLFFCAMVSVAAQRFIFSFASVSQAIVLGVGTGTMAFCGDITASFVKRRLGIKDFSNLLGPQGGVLDRADSLIWLGPALWPAIRFIPEFRILTRL